MKLSNKQPSDCWVFTLLLPIQSRGLFNHINADISAASHLWWISFPWLFPPPFFFFSDSWFQQLVLVLINWGLKIRLNNQSEVKSRESEWKWKCAPSLCTHASVLTWSTCKIKLCVIVWGKRRWLLCDSSSSSSGVCSTASWGSSPWVPSVTVKTRTATCCPSSFVKVYTRRGAWSL